ncbi:UDP-2,3-diacylglucosamine diphosphatase [Chromobacterium phragmitis]|uniref:UDP-2,3-diacylglucosamine diphosphatase n=1 Tax=Chromobacterium phragmitis TaxID=2202141 RepID=UPI000DECE7B7|nr:UDP-2,3-diacylglucosamine diphosphatase [Chromobacterium phragmitis]AXE28593.1 UDP-2,3-diacylglucosamine diphosphatase [Chromobacterium phragmitis]
MAIHFISDLHLADDTPALNQLFLDTLADWRGRIGALYILGDLFEYWVGDDDDSPYLEAPLAAMRAFAAQTPLYVMRGNRDFLLGAGFEARSGARLLDDPTQIDAHGQRILLSHGDALCTDDAAYQQFRAMSRSPQWQQAMLAKPLAERHAIARHARAQSEMNKRQTGLTGISDVTETAVRELLAAHGWPTLIHGHTHRPAHHRHDASSRWVIQDWHGAAGGYLQLDDAGIRPLPLQIR